MAKKKVNGFKKEFGKLFEEPDRSEWIIGGTLMIGLGVGFIFLKTSPLLFVASILIGLGIGLVINALVPQCKK